MVVREISYELSKELILNHHYAHRMPLISRVFGLFEDSLFFDNFELIGVCSIGKPASNTLCFGICGEEYSDKVLELNRLFVKGTQPKNTTSWFLGQVLKKLKKDDLILVSYADTAMNHNGYIYQATNWIYTGITPSRTDVYVSDGKHSRHMPLNDRKNKHLRTVRSSKHRYVYFTGRGKRKYLKNLNYEVQPYPKGENKNYKKGDVLQKEIINTASGETFYE